MNLNPLSQSFVLHFGEMGSRWGINRTVGQIYALLYVTREPLTADDIVEKLGVSRSNVSMGLKELQSWRLVKLEHHPGDRRDFFSAPEDVWQIFKTLAEERQRREVDPTLSMLRDALLETAGSPEDAYAQERMRKMHELIDQITEWFAEVRKLSPETLQSLMGLGSKVVKLLELKERVLGGGRRSEPEVKAPPDASERALKAVPTRLHSTRQ
ncbi:GbsR/MarR family transcriptional regulator [Aquimonas sp.]|jgi:DNA-binding transcriptional regulator GbsR (MarR family)|uniref:GbsR/MarR family transcriptional regulator n=1 Tax=Aquimonas sp. TaxID=1872588 RepID=UPI0037C14631